MQIGHWGPKRKNAKLGFKRGREGSRDLLFETLGPPPYLGTVEARNFKTSNLACRLATGGPKRRMQN